MSKREEARKRTQLLKGLREQHADTVAQTQERMREHNAIRKKIRGILEEGPKTVPEVATATGLPAHQILWHITAMRKYDLLEEGEMSGEYYLYQLPQEASS
jgi:hypothetical protein